MALRYRELHQNDDYSDRLYSLSQIGHGKVSILKKRTHSHHTHTHSSSRLLIAWLLMLRHPYRQWNVFSVLSYCFLLAPEEVSLGQFNCLVCGCKQL
jgi:hypothetical protein